MYYRLNLWQVPSQSAGGRSIKTVIRSIGPGKGCAEGRQGHKSRPEVKADICTCLKTRSNPEVTL